MAVKQSLSDLESLNREWLHVFLAGPGQGEGLAICLPERGWILVDGCNVRRDLPLLRILERWRDESDPIELMVLTHPHEDHTGGFPDLVERLNPLRIAVTAGNNPRDGLELEAAWWRRQYATGETFLEFRLASSVRNAFRAIDSWSESHPDGLVGLHDGAPVSLDNRSATVAVRAPTASDIHEFFTHPSFLDAFGEHANDLSLVLELEFGHTRLLLGADLPHTRNKTTVPSGWAAVTLRHPHLSDHTYLKVPHHGSREALHPAVLGSERGTGRTWCLTPYNSSRLPRSETDQGLEQLLDLQEVIRLTAMPAPQNRQVEHSKSVPLPQLVSMLNAARNNRPVLDLAGERLPFLPLDGLDAIWLCSFDDTGTLRDSRAGRAALLLEGPSGHPERGKK